MGKLNLASGPVYFFSITYPRNYTLFILYSVFKKYEKHYQIQIIFWEFDVRTLEISHENYRLSLLNNS